MHTPKAILEGGNRKFSFRVGKGSISKTFATSASREIERYGYPLVG